MILAALALMVLGAIVVALHAPHDRHERRLAQRFVLTLVVGGALSVGLDLASMLGPVRLPTLEALVESLTFAGCLLLLARTHCALRQQSAKGERQAPDQVAQATQVGTAGSASSRPEAIGSPQRTHQP
ncbi:MAG: hypothetical protein R3D25_05635 [Geminicoccaceae bacterium]